MRKIIFLTLCLIVTMSCSQKPLIFSVMGDVPRSEAEDELLQKQITAHNQFSRSEFMLHVGDIKAGSTPCDEAVYAKVAGYLHGLTVPTFIVPGDNEWNDCDDPEAAWRYWESYFLRFDKFWHHRIKVEQQAGRPENIAFVQKKVLLVGLNLVGGTVYDQTVWDAMIKDAGDWVEQQFSDNKNKVYAAVVFAQANLKDKHLPFTEKFLSSCTAFEKPVLYLHGDGHKWEYQPEWNLTNLTRVQVDKGGIALPLQVTVSPENGFSFNREAFLMEGITSL